MATWSFDPSHSSVGFSVRHLMISKVRGQFNKWEGTFDYDESDPTRSKLAVRIDAASIDTREEKRDAHLRSPDFFDAEQFPEITFESTHVEAIDDESSCVRGNLTMHGVTREIKFTVLLQGTDTDPWNNLRAGLEAVATLNRSEFDMKFNQALGSGNVLVGDKVKIALDISAILQT
jgi:polyisoprenoid-binding protein YceI